MPTSSSARATLRGSFELSQYRDGRDRGLLADRQRALAERSRRFKIALRIEQAGEVVEARRGIGMVGAERLLDRQGALVERPRRGKIALRMEQAGEVNETPPGIGMVDAERRLMDCQGALVERVRRCVGAKRSKTM
jgi:hypothetical protein